MAHLFYARLWLLSSLWWCVCSDLLPSFIFSWSFLCPGVFTLWRTVLFFLFLDTYLADTLLWTVTCLLIQYCCQVFKKYLAVLLAKKVFLILINVSSMGSDCSVVFETLLPCVWDMLDLLLSFGYFMIHFGKIKSSLRVISWFMACVRDHLFYCLY